MHLDDPVSDIQFMNLGFDCRLAVTDSGGIQEETTCLGMPCLTLRPNTERPITIIQGTNRPCKTEDIAAQAQAAITTKATPNPPELWDGKTAARVAASIKRFLSGRF